MSVARALTTSPLGDFFWFQEGPGVRNWQFKDSGVKLLNVANIEKGGGLNLEKSSRYLSVEEVETRYSHFLIDAGDLVIASSGISFDVDGMLRTRGAFVDESHLPLCLNTSTIRFKAKAGISDLGYLKHWLDSLEFREEITKRVTGSAQQNFGPSHLKAMQISLPPLPEQRRIAAILDQADALRAKRRKALAQLDSLTQSIFIEMFGDSVSNPKKWPLAGIDEVCELIVDCVNRTAPVVDGPTPYKMIRTTNVKYGKVNLSEVRYVTEATFQTWNRRTTPIRGDIVLTREAPLGEAGVLESNENVFLGQRLMLYRTDIQRLAPKYLLSSFQSQFLQSQFAKHGSGSTVKHLSLPACRNFQILLPPIQIQNEFAKRITVLEKLNIYNRGALSTLGSLFASLQHRAFQGEL